MHILIVEDSAFKYKDICNAITDAGYRGAAIEHAEYLEDAFKKIEKNPETKYPYDLIITDMWYPIEKGGYEVESGDVLIKTMKEKGIDIPIILCSSARYAYPGILGTVHYSKNEVWEMKLAALLTEVK